MFNSAHSSSTGALIRSSSTSRILSVKLFFHRASCTDKSVIVNRFFSISTVRRNVLAPAPSREKGSFGGGIGRFSSMINHYNLSSSLNPYSTDMNYTLTGLLNNCSSYYTTTRTQQQHNDTDHGSASSSHDEWEMRVVGSPRNYY